MNNTSVLQLSKTGRLPETGLPVLENKSAVMDFVMNPFDEESIAVGMLKVYMSYLPTP